VGAPWNPGGESRTSAVHYTEAFKAQMVRRLLGPPGISANALAKEVGVSQSQLSRWSRVARVQGDVTTTQKTNSKSTRAWTAKEKLRLVAAAEGLEGQELSELLRREGVHFEQLKQWRQLVHGALSENSAGKGPTAAEGKLAKKRIKELERELRRKEKALAESAAMIFLEKKLQAMGWDERHAQGGLSETSDE
jgi:transposase